MNKKVKRGVLTALVLNVLAPYSGLLYVHKPVRALVMALITLAICAAIRFFDLLASFDVMLVLVSILGAMWLLSTLSAMLLARKGLKSEMAQADIGPWIAGYLLTMIIAAALPNSAQYKGYALTTPSMEPTLAVGDYVFSRRNPFSGNGSPNPDAPRPGEFVVVEDAHGRSFVRRLAGLPGDILEARDGALIRNGEKFLSANTIAFPGQATLWHVPANMVFVLADNPTNVSASVSGEGNAPPATPAALHAVAVNQSAVRGKVLYRYWGADLERLGRIEP